MPGHVSSFGVPNNLKILLNWSSTSEPGKSGLPKKRFLCNSKQLEEFYIVQPALASSAKIHPADHMSMEVVYNLAPNKTSGGRYQSVTTSAE